MRGNYAELHIVNRIEERNIKGDIMYIAQILHLGIGELRVVKQRSSPMLENEIEKKFTAWDSMWEKFLLKEKEQADEKSQQELAKYKTEEAKTHLFYIKNILHANIRLPSNLDWEGMMNNRIFTEINPAVIKGQELLKLEKSYQSRRKKISTEPKFEEFLPRITIVDNIFKCLKKPKIEAARIKFSEAHKNWKLNKNQIYIENEKLKIELEAEKSRLADKYQNEEKKWKIRKEQFLSKQIKENQAVQCLKKDYLESKPTAIEEYYSISLKEIIQPDEWKKDFDVEYNPKNRGLVIDFLLPPPEKLPTVARFDYSSKQKKIIQTLISESERSILYENAIYSVCLSVIANTFLRDSVNALDFAVFNGWVDAIDNATGESVRSCIVSISVKKDEFSTLNLHKVEPKACFKRLKGIGSTKLIGIIPVTPILKMEKTDKRFVESHAVSEKLDERYNLAMMNWEDFEHLIRELFEREFSSEGSEVKITRASRDGGVDAVVFDPDPIRGGKIVIQAKRYTSVVGVSAVRDLWGTVMNEGAMKGILVTTADYGADSYEFAKDKPLTLIHGGHLLHLLSKHGQNARIDLNEAKEFQKKRPK